jgi:O-glycosyl hydrolase
MKKILRRKSVRTTTLLSAVMLTTAAVQAGTCSIDGNSYKQTIDGFGMCSKWAPVLTSAQADAFFNTLGFSLHRCGIDSSSNFGTEASNASAAHSRGAKVFGTPWSPPASMKSNGNIVGGQAIKRYADQGLLDSAAMDYVHRTIRYYEKVAQAHQQQLQALEAKGETINQAAEEKNLKQLGQHTREALQNYLGQARFDQLNSQNLLPFPPK